MAGLLRGLLFVAVTKVRLRGCHACPAQLIRRAECADRGAWAGACFCHTRPSPHPKCAGPTALQVRAMVAEVGAAVEPLQPGSQAAAADCLATAAWASQPVAQQAVAQEAQEGQPTAAAAAAAAEQVAPAAAEQPGLAAEADVDSQAADAVGQQAKRSGSLSSSSSLANATNGGSSAAKDPQPDGPAQQPVEPPHVVRPSAVLEARPRSALRRGLERAGLGLPQLLPALHMAVLFAAAGTLTVCRQAFLGLGGRSPWVAFTGALVLPFLLPCTCPLRARMAAVHMAAFCLDGG